MPHGVNVKSALDFRTHITAMLDDPDLTGDLLIFAIALEDRSRRPDQRRKKWIADISSRIGWESGRIRYVIGSDAPRYDGPPYPDGCIAEMIRREGLCGKKPTHGWSTRNPLTGALTTSAYCSRHATAEHLKLYRESWVAWRANGEPEPPPNAGGVLERHFPSKQWARIYAWARPDWTDPLGRPEPTPPKPTLRLIRIPREETP